MNTLPPETRKHILICAHKYEFYNVRQFIHSVQSNSKLRAELNEEYLSDSFLFACFEEAHRRKFPQVIRKNILEMLHKDF